MDEIEARMLLKQNKIERDINDVRTCAEIVKALVFLTIQPEVEPPVQQDEI